jgi:hypothetical protein
MNSSEQEASYMPMLNPGKMIKSPI